MIRMDDERINWAVSGEIRAARARRGWTQDQLAERSGVPKGTLRRYEDGSRPIPIDKLVRIAIALGIEIDDIERAVRRASEGDPGSDAESRGPKTTAAADTRNAFRRKSDKASEHRDRLR